MKTEVSTKQLEAQRAFGTLCQTLDDLGWKYQSEPENFIVRTGARGEDLSMPLHIVVDQDKGVMYVKSPMPYTIPENARDVIGQAVNVANWSMLNGCFEYDRRAGFLGFRMVMPYHNCAISREMCRYMVMLTCSMVDRFNDKFLAVAKGSTSMSDFEKFALNNN